MFALHAAGAGTGGVESDEIERSGELEPAVG
jgi:hypothetical protein